MQAAIRLKKLHGKGYLHGDISPYTLAKDGTAHATIIDLATMRGPDDPEVC